MSEKLPRKHALHVNAGIVSDSTMSSAELAPRANNRGVRTRILVVEIF